MTPKDFMLRFGADWQRKYKAPYAWNYGRDSKAIKTLEAYVMSVYPMETDSVLLKIIAQFVADNDPFLTKMRHPLSELCKCPSKWFPKEETKRAIENVAKAEEVFRIMYSDEEFQERFLEYAAKQPLRAAKGFQWTGGLLKHIHPGHYQKALDILKDLLGNELFEKYLTATEESTKERLNMKGRHEQLIQGNEKGLAREKEGTQAVAEVQEA